MSNILLNCSFSLLFEDFFLNNTGKFRPAIAVSLEDELNKTYFTLNKHKLKTVQTFGPIAPNYILIEGLQNVQKQKL